MTFASVSFLVFFVVILCLLGSLGAITRKNENRYRTISQVILLVASYFFYGWWNVKFCLLLLFVTAVAYATAIAMERSEKYAKLWMGAGIVVPLFVLAYFKYYNFFVDSFCDVFHLNNSIALDIILPVGISFYTFQAISYMIDVYRKEIPVMTNFVKFALYIAFFPQLVAGPIVKAKEFLPQLEETRKISLQRLNDGVCIFLFGLFKKVVLADNLSVFVDDVFRVPSAYSWISVWLAVISYSIQIYCDFSGYSDMAVGCAKCIGYDLPRNFNLPYISKNVSEFWKRWHISLSSWLMQYLYIPLGGNRKGRFRTYLNLLLTMVLGGLWHGASWTFVAWGTFHGLALCVHKAYHKWCPKKKTSSIRMVIDTIFTYLYVSICWIFFRAENFSQAISVMRQMMPGQVGIQKFFSFSIFAIILTLIATIIAIGKAHHQQKNMVSDNGIADERSVKSEINGFYPIIDLSKFWSLVLFWIVIGLIAGLGYVEGSPFIYFAF